MFSEHDYHLIGLVDVVVGKEVWGGVPARTTQNDQVEANAFQIKQEQIQAEFRL